MKSIRKFLGPVWMLLGAYVAYYGVTDSWAKIGSANLEDRVFGWVVLCVLVPIIVGGLILFGKYALDGEYSMSESDRRTGANRDRTTPGAADRPAGPKRISE